MKVKRQKISKRSMQLYQHSFGFREPYQILVDGNFVHASIQCRLDMRTQFPKLLVGSTNLYITNCVLNELRSLGPDFSGSVIAAKRFERRKCPHSKSVSASQCLRDLIGDSNPQNLLVASQDLSLRSNLRRIPGVPLIYINKSVMILEPTSSATQAKMNEIEIAKTLPASFEKSLLKKASENAPEEEVKPRKKKAKGPNPLSCKKKTNASEQQQKNGVKNEKKKKVATKKSKSTKEQTNELDLEVARDMKEGNAAMEVEENSGVTGDELKTELIEEVKEEAKRKKARRGRRGRTAREKREQAKAKDALVPSTTKSLFEDEDDEEGGEEEVNILLKETEEMDVDVKDGDKETLLSSESESESESESSAEDESSSSSEEDESADEGKVEDDKEEDIALDSLMDLDDDPYLVVQPKRDGRRYGNR